MSIGASGGNFKRASAILGQYSLTCLPHRPSPLHCRLKFDHIRLDQEGNQLHCKVNAIEATCLSHGKHEVGQHEDNELHFRLLLSKHLECESNVYQLVQKSICNKSPFPYLATVCHKMYQEIVLRQFKADVVFLWDQVLHMCEKYN